MESGTSQSRIDAQKRLITFGFYVGVLAVSGASVWWALVESGRGGGGMRNDVNLIVLLIAAFAAGISYIPAAKRGREDFRSAALVAALVVSIPTVIYIGRVPLREKAERTVRRSVQLGSLNTMDRNLGSWARIAR